MISRGALAGCVLSVVLAAFAGAAAAQPSVQAATAHHQAAEDAMARKAFADAAREYEAAYREIPEPIFLYKLGVAHASAGACEAAAAAFDRYLAEGDPSPEYRAKAEEQRATCKPAPANDGTNGAGTPSDAETSTGAGTGAGAAAEPGAFGTRPGAGVDDPDTLPSLGAGGPSFTDSPSSWKRSAGWIAAGTTLGLVAVGAVLALSAEGSEEDIAALQDFRIDQGGTLRPLRWDEVDAQYLDLVDEGERFDRMATYTLAAAGVTAAAAITFFVLDATSARGERGGLAVAPRIGRDGAGVRVGWQF
jgi:hypothetical protein